MRFWCQLGFLLPPQIHQNPEKKRSQEASKFWSFFASIFFRCLFRFGSQVGAMLATVFDPRRSQDAPRRLQDGHKMHQVVSKTPPRRPQDRVPDGPTSFFGRFFAELWMVFWEFWKIFWKRYAPKTLLKTLPGYAQDPSENPPEILINWRGGTKAKPSQYIFFQKKKKLEYAPKTTHLSWGNVPRRLG